MRLFGEVLSEEEDSLDFSVLSKLIDLPVVKPRFRISVLNPDETINYIIPSEDIPEDGISYTEEYQNGQRRNISLKLINISGKYSPSVNNIWLNTKFKFEIGLVSGNHITWFPKGIYVIGDISQTEGDSDKTISIQLKDKYYIFESKLGILQDTYEIPVDSDIQDAIKGILNFSMGDGYVFDYKEPILDASFIGLKTQASIRVDNGGNLSQIIESLATQLSAEYYYNNVGQLCFYPINETLDDSVKPIIWNFKKLTRSVNNNLTLNYKMEDIINTVKVVGDNIESGICSAIATNDNPQSPICVQQVGKRVAPTYTESSVWNNQLASDLAQYYLRQSSFMGVDFSCSVSFNPILAVNNICEMENEVINLNREKLLIVSISYGSNDGFMSLKLCNVRELPIVYR